MEKYRMTNPAKNWKKNQEKRTPGNKSERCGNNDSN